MFSETLQNRLRESLEKKKQDGTFKQERIITSSQQVEIQLEGNEQFVLNFCANNYLGLANDPEILEAASTALNHFGFGMASVRFICGTHSLHKELEQSISDYLNTDDTLLYNSCYDANGGLFENLLTEEDTVFSASMNHASIIDGIRLSKSRRELYEFNDPDDLEKRLKSTSEGKLNLVVTDGVFSMEGELAPLDQLVDICKRYGALLVVDDSHATGFIGKGGRGTAEHFGVHDSVDLFTGTLGKALGGATGGYISGKKELIEWFRNTSRPYLFSNSLAPALVAGALKSLEIIQSEKGNILRKTLHENTAYFREQMLQRGFKIEDGIHPIVPIMLGDAQVAADMANDLLKEGIYVIGFSYPVVPEGKARIRVQISAAHERQHLNRAIDAFEKAGKKFGAIQ